jgi:hypothetical protein
LYVECKAKLRFEEAVVTFVDKCRRDALGSIVDHLRHVDAGLLIQISVHEDASVGEISEMIKRMVAAGEAVRDEPGYRVEIRAFESGEVVLRQPMSIVSADFWRWAMGFDRWRDWHYVLPGGQFRLANLSNAIADAVKRPVLICIRSTRLADSTQRILPALKAASRRQFAAHAPGAIHMLVNTSLYGLGEKTRIEYVAESLRAAGRELLRNYDRVWRVNDDVVTPPELGRFDVSVRRVSVVNEAMAGPAEYIEPPAVLLW